MDSEPHPRPCMTMSATSEVQKVFIDVYYAGQVKRVKFYRGTSSDDLLDLILKLFHLLPAENPTLLKHQCVFYDEDDDPLCFSPDVLPTGTKLYLRVQSLSPDSGKTVHVPSATKTPQKWTWDPVMNAHPEIAYILSDGNTTVNNKRTDFSSASARHSMPILCGTASFTSGLHRWRVAFTNPNTYCGFGLVSQAERDQVRKKDFGAGFNSYPLFDKFFAVTCGDADGEYQFILDMEKRQCTVKAGSRLDKTVTDLPRGLASCYHQTQ